MSRECIVSGWLGKDNWSSLGWMKNADSTSKYIKNACHYWFGPLTHISIPDASSESIFCFTFPIQDNGGKQSKLFVVKGQSQIFSPQNHVIMIYNYPYY